jgi:hypothetical protein
MGRVSDYARFAIWLLGIGYIAFWPLLSHDGNGPLGAALVCPSFLGFLCHFPHAFALPPALQWIGLLSAGWIGLTLLARLIGRMRRGAIGRTRAASALSARIPATVRPRRSKPLAPVRHVKPRRQFGLRGRPE